VALTGPAGAGKTTIARYAALRAGADTMWFCPLADAATLDAFVETVARTVRQTTGESTNALGVVEEISSLLADSGHALLVLDDLSRLSADDEVGRAVERWVAAAPELRILATARFAPPFEARTIRVEPLSEDDAVELFASRTRRLRTDFELDDETTPTVRDVVNGLERNPLAIELAAARSTAMRPEEILERLRRRLDAGAGGLEASFLDSWDLLEAWERAVLAQVSVFRGGFDMEAAQAVALVDPVEAPSVHNVLDDAIARAMLYAATTMTGELRFHFCENLRAFAFGQLDDPAGAMRRHAGHFAQAARAHDDGGEASLNFLDRERENLELALLNCLEEAPGDAADIAVALTDLFVRLGPRYRARQCLDLLEGQPLGSHARQAVARARERLSRTG